MLNPGSGNSGKPHDDITLSQPIKTAARQQNLHSRPSAPKLAEHSPSTHNHSNLPKRQDVHCRTRHAKASAAAGALGSARSKVAPELAPQAFAHSMYGLYWGYTGVIFYFLFSDLFRLQTRNAKLARPFRRKRKNIRIPAHSGLGFRAYSLLQGLCGFKTRQKWGSYY